MSQCDENNVNDLLKFILDAPCNDEVVAMDCNDYCDQIARLAELVAAGTNIGAVLPALEEHMRHYADCREEFEALVAILKAENTGQLAESGTSNETQS